MDEYMVELGGYEYAVQATSPEEARQKGLLAHVKSVGQQSVDQAVGDATTRREEALASAPMSPWAESAMAGMSGEGGAFADPNATGGDIIKRGAGLATTAGALATGTGLVTAPIATMKGLAGGLLGSAAGSEAGQWVGRRVPLVGGETAGNILGALGGLVGGVGGGAVAPKLGRDQLLAMLPGKGGMLGSILGGGESAAARGAATQAAKTVAPEVVRKAELDIAIKEARLAKIAADAERAKELHAARLAKAAGTAPKAGPKAVPRPEPVPEPAPAPRTEGATALKPEPELLPDEAVSLVAEPLPFTPRPSKGTTTMPTNLGGKAKPGTAPTPEVDLEEVLRRSVEAAKAKKAGVGSSPLREPRIEVGAERVGKGAGLTKEEVRRQTGPIVGEAVGEASPVFPQKAFDAIYAKLRAMPRGGPERLAYAAAARGEKAMSQVESIRRTLEASGLVVPLAAIAAAIRRKEKEEEST